MARKRLFPVTRVHEPLSVEIEISGGKVVDAYCAGVLYRGFEQMMRGRDPRDAFFFTQRICGICSSAHAIAAAYALQDAFNLQTPPNGTLLQNLIHGADVLQNHLRHFYVLILPDYVKGPDVPPFVPRTGNDFRLPSKVNDQLMQHYWQGVELSAKAHQMLAIFGGKAPHQQAIYPTGVSVPPTSDRVSRFKALLDDLVEFIQEKMIFDVETIAHYYPEYFQIGRGYGNFLSYGYFPKPNSQERHFPAGIILDGQPSVKKLDPSYITEAITYSWYEADKEVEHPGKGKTYPSMDKPGAYSWVKAPRYQGIAMETGPLARGWISGDYRQGISVMDRIKARVLEAAKVGNLMQEWLMQLTPAELSLLPYEVKESGVGAGFTDAMRGALAHWIEIKGGRISRYQIVTPTAWNFSPRDDQGRRGPVEEALVGTPVENPDHLIEVGRVIRSFDPCFTCAVHLIQAKGSMMQYRI
ncbi:nickel-dependent hydrogenase large subunit [Calderihabitans maritimus]|uniref:Cytochrome B n=1 Tax=Calderihabitans maritimus TaxID=1246530 RepID=A0A1Z5HNW1_9FIRM|nr:nickel-dependent hydrogenase large subunit [Calderihabitans maritimus]GAW91213.1 cytochrome B [Calderihabitans maritimus]